LCKHLRLNTMRLTMQVNNLFYTSKVGNDIDPESYGLSSGSRIVNQPRMFSVGLSAGF